MSALTQAIRSGRITVYRMPAKFWPDARWGMQDNAKGVITDGPTIAGCWRTCERAECFNPFPTSETPPNA